MSVVKRRPENYSVAGLVVEGRPLISDTTSSTDIFARRPRGRLSITWHSGRSRTETCRCSAIIGERDGISGTVSTQAPQRMQRAPYEMCGRACPPDCGTSNVFKGIREKRRSNASCRMV
jgi:hypothetical protein